ncbi:TspO/MBR family protein [Lachnospiraceae bacterium 54-53]
MILSKLIQVNRMMSNRKKLTAFLALPLAVGALAGLLAKNGLSVYGSLNLPSMAPPGWLLPIVRIFLYILMGLGSYLIAVSPCPGKKEALTLYGIQLFFHFIWSLLFFKLQFYPLSFGILLILWHFTVKMIPSFWPVNPIAAILQIPCLLWVVFTGYLNLAIIFLN